MRTVNDLVMVEPFEFNHDKDRSSVKGFVLTDKLANTLVKSKVLADSKNYKAGQTVFIKSESYGHPQVKQKFSYEDKEFILIQELFIVAVEG